MVISIKNYLRYLIDKRYYGVLIYLALPFIFGGMLAGGDDTDSGFAGFIFSIAFMNYGCLFLFMYVFGNKVCAKILGASRVSRMEYKKAIEDPVRRYIQDLRSMGVILDDRIQVYVSEMDYPFAYGVGQKILVVSTGLLDYPDLMEAKIKHELFRMYNLGSSTTLLLLGQNICIFILSLVLFLMGAVDAKTGSRRKRFLGGSEAGDGALLSLGVLALMAIWFVFARLLLKSFVADKTKEADDFIYKLGLGEVFCSYLDLCKQLDRPHRIKIFEFAKPSNNDRIAFFQGKGVQYSRV